MCREPHREPQHDPGLKSAEITLCGIPDIGCARNYGVSVVGRPSRCTSASSSDRTVPQPGQARIQRDRQIRHVAINVMSFLSVQPRRRTFHTRNGGFVIYTTGSS